MSMIRKLFEPLRPLWNLYKRLLKVDRQRVHRYFAYDEERFWRYAGSKHNRREGMLAQIVINYHVAEKGLTMPNRRLGFGHDLMLELMRRIRGFDGEFGTDDAQIQHAIGVVKAYLQLHMDQNFDMTANPDYWESLQQFAVDYASVPTVEEYHFTHDKFYTDINSSFPDFARSRHCVRNYSETPIDMAVIRKAIELAQTAPSACNRQHARVYCLPNKETFRKVLELQGGNRGFGQLADKVLVVTVDLADITLSRERNDAYVNGGMFLMNLCYALHHFQIAHCILTWGQEPERDQQLRRMIPVKDNEEIVALLSCGIAPAEFDVPVSKRRPLDQVLTVVG